MSLSNVHNSQEFWNTIRSFKNSYKPVNNVTITEWENFFSEFFNSTQIPTPQFLDCCHPWFDTAFTIEELQLSLLKCKTNKAGGKDGLNNEFYKTLPSNWQHYVLNLFNNILSHEKVPSAWSNVQMFLMHKKGNSDDPANYRGIALINSICKLFTQIIYFRLQSWCEENFILNEHQSGFRPQRDTIDNIFLLSSASHLQLRQKGHSTFVIFIDFQRAFDSVNHNLLWQKLFDSGLFAKLIRILQRL